ncbi:cyclodeaminase/cyclohydrolase family protein [Pseudomonas oryzihabitans]|uniref:cyclodeaminase/cyclohydrolase family protein n=1 Tax=Pseudomonas oryzihabitans TaxID=47885 RepID=UPI002860258A|nr:cyclodeaminase/cyclohydrolase family protein [Pseudomonas psychrotolerans]MDR6676153.1 formiminotetrahydrofolate cyclodeaminase [Pseudomonas psychrotolerans]
MNETFTLWQQTLAQFRDGTGSTLPTPGSGSAATVAAVLGIALVLKGLKISQQRQPVTRHAELIALGERLQEALSTCADADVQAFANYLEADRQANGAATEEGERRQQALNLAAANAIQIPIATAQLCLEALDLAVIATPLTIEPLRSDALAGGRLLHGALGAVLTTVDADRNGLKSGDAREAARQMRDKLQQQADQRLAQLRATPVPQTMG